MKKAVAIVLTTLYMTVTSGIVVNIHYCMGEVTGIAMGSQNSGTCGNCGMDNKGCCHDDLQIVKLTDNHQAVSAYTEWVKAVAVMVMQVSRHHEAIEQASYAPVAQALAPPRMFSRNNLYCVYRI